MKASAIEVNGEWMDVYKDPITDQGKKSKKGVLALVKRDVGFETVRAEQLVKGAHGTERNYLRTVYKDGVIVVDDAFESIRERAAV